MCKPLRCSSTNRELEIRSGRAAKLLDRADPISIGPDTETRGTMLDTWFDPDSGTIRSAHPSALGKSSSDIE
jgi:hypothetical protein